MILDPYLTLNTKKQFQGIKDGSMKGKTYFGRNCTELLFMI